MGARQKLNQAYLNGTLVMATMIGFMAQSWNVFWLALALGIASSFFGGEIRTNGRPKK
jgi:hypothetical protein